MLKSVIIYLPFMVCLMWFTLYLLRRNKTRAQVLLAHMLAVVGLAYLGDAVFFDKNASTTSMIMVDALSQFVTPSVAPLLLMFVWARYGRPIWQWSMLFWMMIPIFFGVTSLLLYFLIGIDDALIIKQCIRDGTDLPEKLDGTIYHVQMFLESILFYVVVSLQFVFLFVYMIRTLIKSRFTLRSYLRYLNGKARISTNNLVIFNTMILLFVAVGRQSIGQIYYTLPAVGIVFSLLSVLLMFKVAFLCLFVDSKTMNRNTLKIVGIVKKEANEELVELIQDEKEEDAKATAEIITSVEIAIPQTSEASNASTVNMTPEEYEAVLKTFNTYLIDKRWFLRKDVTLINMSKQLNLSRAYLSSLVNREYGMPFRDVVGKLRVDYAIKYMQQHPEKLQDEVAKACGFTSAAVFNRKFVQIVGMPPCQWRDSLKNQD